jgi:hypothetical protein
VAGILIGPMDKNPLVLGVDLYIVQLYGEGTIGATWPRICPHCHLPSSKWLDMATDEGPQEVRVGTHKTPISCANILSKCMK